MLCRRRAALSRGTAIASLLPAYLTAYSGKADQRMGVRAFFFDIDGTLVDSNEFHVLAWHEAFLRHAQEVSLAAIRRQIGKGADMLIPALEGGSECQAASIIQFHRLDTLGSGRFRAPYRHASPTSAAPSINESGTITGRHRPLV